MICGTASETRRLSGTIKVEEQLCGSISGDKILYGKISLPVNPEIIPYYETSNSSGGTTVYIGKEI